MAPVSCRPMGMREASTGVDVKRVDSGSKLARGEGEDFTGYAISAVNFALDTREISINTSASTMVVPQKDAIRLLFTCSSVSSACSSRFQTGLRLGACLGFLVD